jgi:hypothetical protein
MTDMKSLEARIPLSIVLTERGSRYVVCIVFMIFTVAHPTISVVLV